MVERVDSRERNPQNPRNPTKTRKWENTPNLKPQTTRIQDPTRLLVGEGERGKQRSQDPQMGTSLARAAKTYVASRVCNVDCQYLSKLCPPSPPRRVMCIDDGRRLSSLRTGWYLLLGDLVPCVFISSSIDQLRLDWTRSVLSGPRFSLPVTALPSSCSGAKAVRACH